MSSEVIAMVIGFTVGMAIVITVLWPDRAKIRQGWRDLWGLGDDEQARQERIQQRRREQRPGKQMALMLTVAIFGLMAEVATVVIANNKLVDIVNIIGAAIFLILIVILTAEVMRSRSAS